MDSVWKTAVETYSALGSAVAPDGCKSFYNQIKSFEEAPDLDQLGQCLKSFGWQAVVTNGFVEYDDYFALIANRVLPINMAMRTHASMDFSDFPDLIHEIFGHIARFGDAQMMGLMQKCAELGASNIPMMDKISWWLLETLVLVQDGNIVPLGAVPLSSTTEFNRALDLRNHRPITIEFLTRDFDPSQPQPYFGACRSFDEVHAFLNDYAKSNRK